MPSGILVVLPELSTDLGYNRAVRSRISPCLTMAFATERAQLSNVKQTIAYISTGLR